MKIVKISQNKEAIVDEGDLKRVIKNKWSYHHTGYVVRGKPQISLHRFIMGAKKGEEVDHINGNRLDNRRSNLRFCTRSQNIQNTSSRRGILKGLEWRESRKAWAVRVMSNGKRNYVGYFKSKADAIRARNLALVGLHGEFAKI